MSYDLLNTARNEMAYCPGCSHTAVLEHLAAAVDSLGLKRQDICVVTDIGCVGLADRFLGCHTFHGLHGRSLTYAEGLKRARPELTVIVLIGDGGCGIGSGHLIHAARRAADINVVVCNNFNFGMTGGQHSPTTPTCSVTSTTRGGATEFPFDICQTVAVSGASHVVRFSAMDREGPSYFERMLATPGFCLADVWELCVAYYVPSNKLTPPKLNDMSERLGMPFGVLRHEPVDRRWNGSGHLTAIDPPSVPTAPVETTPASTVPALHCLERAEICVAGSAGRRIRSAAGVIGEIAVAGGLYAAQHDDFPITVRKGHSISNLIIADRPILYSGVDKPALLIILSDDGLKRLGSLEMLSEACLILAEMNLNLPKTHALVRHVDCREIEQQVTKTSAALAVLTAGLVDRGWIDPQSLIATAEATLGGKYRDENLRAIRVGIAKSRSLTGHTECQSSIPGPSGRE